MAYHNAQGKVTIDEAAANEDINKIRQAISKLEEAQNRIQQLNTMASSMKGQTAEAILAQCERLNKKVSDLIEKLNRSIGFIKDTVQKYKEEDEANANKIIGLGGV